MNIIMILKITHILYKCIYIYILIDYNNYICIYILCDHIILFDVNSIVIVYSLKSHTK